MTRLLSFAMVVVMVGAVGCSSDDLDSDEEARRAYFGLDESIGKSLTLGFVGFNAATNANLPANCCNDVGIVSGTLVITGQVDAGTSDNKQMRLRIGMVDYNDGVFRVDGSDQDIDITYDTSADPLLQPELDLSLHSFPGGTYDGTLIGDYSMTGDIEGTATLNLIFTGDISDDGTGKTVRTPGMTHVTGTATSGDGTFDVDITI
ncbi:MAG TPA: hypothetical protein VFQ53_22820 [Kofleriaceae bacterium]|nr:hypothetical protein [Kofleriaceae bacterium]